MSNFLTMVERIEDELDDEGIRTQIQREIQSAIRHYSTRRFFFTEQTFTFATVAAQEAYDIDDAAAIDSFLEVQSSYVTGSGVRYPLVPIDYPSLSEAQSGSMTGRPTNWAFFARAFWMFPIPTAAETVTIGGHVRLAALSADTDTNAWMTDGEALIRGRAKRFLAMNVTKSTEDAQAAQVEEGEAMEALDRETNLRRGRRLLRVDAALVGCQRYDINSG